MLALGVDGDGPLTVLALGAHCDDVAIGAGGLLLGLQQRRPSRLHLCVLTGAGSEREQEEHRAGKALQADASVEVHGLPDGRLPEHWGQAKSLLQATREAVPAPDVVLAPRLEDAHQDHRLLAELVTQVWRDALVLRYEIPKWDGDVSPSHVYGPLTAELMAAKWELLDASYPSQRSKSWWDRELLAGQARLRGAECRSPYAEGFTCEKALLLL